jgi:hypothetical protein
MGRDIVIIPNRGLTGGTTHPEIRFSGLTDSSIKLKVEDDGSIVFDGNTGGLFEITDSKDGLLSAVSDVSGLPILAVYSDNRVVAGKWDDPGLTVINNQVFVGPTATTNASLYVSGNEQISGTLNIGTIGGGSPVINLGLDGSGNVVTGTTGGGGGSTSGKPYTKLVTNQTIGSTRLVQADGTTEILVSSLLIPGGTFGVSDVLTIKLWSELNAGVATIAHRMYVNSSASIGGAMILGNLSSENISPSTTTFSQYIERELSIENTTNTYYPSDGGTLTGWQQSISSSVGGVSPGFKSANIDWSVDQYLIFTCQFNSAPGAGEYGDIRYMSINN